MKRIRSIVIIELFIVLIYLSITLLSITIQPINLILGIFCILIIPGYNLLRIFKPQSTIMQKLGYITILSLAVGNISMFFSYLFLYDFTVPTGDIGVIFDPVMLILSLQILNLTLISVNELILLKKLKNNNTIDINTDRVRNYFHKISFNGIIKKCDLRSLIIYSIFFLSLIFLSLSTYYSSVPDISLDTVYEDYRANFTFFLRVPSIFYLFLTIAIISLGFIIFFTKNKYLILISISIFLYTLWILPYIQIGNYFSLDSRYIYDKYQSYLDGGLKPADNFSLTQGIPDAYRYSTDVFTTILLVVATQINVTSVLWFIYPLCYVSIPFFFYSIFQSFSKRKLYNSKNTEIFVLTILAIVTAQFIKYGHSATTGLLGTYIFFILIIEFFFFTNERDFKKKQIIFITLLFFFLAITHTEECIYFLIFMFLYSIYQIIIKYNNIGRNHLSEFKRLRKFTLFWAFFLLLLSLIFYFTQEFYGWIFYYISRFLKENFLLNFILNIYSSSKFLFIFDLHNTFTMSYIVIFLIPIGILLFYSIFYLLLIKFKKLIAGINHLGRNICKIFHKIIVKVISQKYFLSLFLIMIYCGIFIFDLFFYKLLTEKGILILIEIFLISIIYVINTIIFLLGIKYYKIKNDKENYFILIILCSSLSFCYFLIIGDPQLIVYTLTRFFSYFIFFNLIIVQDTSFRNFMKKKEIYLMILVILLLFIGTFYSLMTLSYG